MRFTRKTTQDINQLSAYLDDALTPAQKQKLEARLAVDPQLREQLEQLRRTKIILGSLPRLRAPHRYTLTPEMVKVRKPKRQPLFTTLRLATSLAAILLVVLVGVELILGGSFLRQPLTAEAPMMESARIAEETTPQPLIQWGQAGLGGATGGDAYGMGGDTYIEEAPAEGIEAAPPDMPQEEPAPELESEAMPEELPEAAPEEKAVEEKSIILGINPDQGGEIIERSEPAVTVEEPAPLWRNLIRGMMIGLALVAIGGAITLLALRTRRLT